jgi:hypothetical protein
LDVDAQPQSPVRWPGDRIVVPEDESAQRIILRIGAYLPVVWIRRERVLLDVDENQQLALMLLSAKEG